MGPPSGQSAAACRQLGPAGVVSIPDDKGAPAQPGRGGLVCRASLARGIRGLDRRAQGCPQRLVFHAGLAGLLDSCATSTNRQDGCGVSLHAGGAAVQGRRGHSAGPAAPVGLLAPGSGGRAMGYPGAAPVGPADPRKNAPVCSGGDLHLHQFADAYLWNRCGFTGHDHGSPPGVDSGQLRVLYPAAVLAGSAGCFLSGAGCGAVAADAGGLRRPAGPHRFGDVASSPPALAGGGLVVVRCGPAAGHPGGPPRECRLCRPLHLSAFHRHRRGAGLGGRGNGAEPAGALAAGFHHGWSCRRSDGVVAAAGPGLG
jgi:hypothetical protein